MDVAVAVEGALRSASALFNMHSRRDQLAPMGLFNEDVENLFTALRRVFSLVFVCGLWVISGKFLLRGKEFSFRKGDLQIQDTVKKNWAISLEVDSFFLEVH